MKPAAPHSAKHGRKPQAKAPVGRASPADTAELVSAVNRLQRLLTSMQQNLAAIESACAVMPQHFGGSVAHAQRRVQSAAVTVAVVGKQRRASMCFVTARVVYGREKTAGTEIEAAVVHAEQLRHCARSLRVVASCSGPSGGALCDSLPLMSSTHTPPHLSKPLFAGVILRIHPHIDGYTPSGSVLDSLCLRPLKVDSGVDVCAGYDPSIPDSGLDQFQPGALNQFALAVTTPDGKPVTWLETAALKVVPSFIAGTAPDVVAASSQVAVRAHVVLGRGHIYVQYIGPPRAAECVSIQAKVLGVVMPVHSTYEWREFWGFTAASRDNSRGWDAPVAVPRARLHPKCVFTFQYQSEDYPFKICSEPTHIASQSICNTYDSDDSGDWHECMLQDATVEMEIRPFESVNSVMLRLFSDPVNFGSESGQSVSALHRLLYFKDKNYQDDDDFPQFGFRPFAKAVDLVDVKPRSRWHDPGRCSPAHLFTFCDFVTPCACSTTSPPLCLRPSDQPFPDGNCGSSRRNCSTGAPRCTLGCAAACRFSEWNSK